MILYASRTGTKRNLKVLKDNGWRLMLSATGVWRTEGFRYSIDNGAWTSFQAGTSFDRLKFLQVVSYLGADADFVVVPDIVAGGLDSLAFSLEWMRPLSSKGLRNLLLPVQDGMTPKDVLPVLRAWPSLKGIFVGGSTEWKDQTIPTWGQFGINHNTYVHVGRVNTKSRMDACKSAAVSSIDGSGPSRFAIHAEKMSAWSRQLGMRLYAS